MKINKSIVVMLIFALVIGVALVGGSWATSFAAGTIPENPPNEPFTGLNQELNNDSGGGGVGGGGVGGFAGGGGALGPAGLTPVNDSDCPANLKFEGTCYKATSGGQVVITDAALVAAFKADPNKAIYWYNGTSWVKLITSLVNGQLVAVVSGPGNVAFGSP